MLNSNRNANSKLHKRFLLAKTTHTLSPFYFSISAITFVDFLSMSYVQKEEKLFPSDFVVRVV